MHYVKIEDGSIIDFFEFRKLYPNISFFDDGVPDEFLEEHGFAILSNGVFQPEYGFGQTLEPSEKALFIDGEWKREFIVTGELQDLPDVSLDTFAIIQSPNGTAFKIMVNDDGQISTEPLEV